MAEDEERHRWYTGTHKNFAAKVTEELNVIRSRILIIESQLGMPHGGEVSPTTTHFEGPEISDITPESFGPWYGDLEDIEKETGEKVGSKDYTESLVQATYAIRTLSIAMRGYLQLVDQLGLSKDQKKMIREVENVMMMIMKLVQVVGMASTIIDVAEENYPKALLTLIMMGGFAASSGAYASHVVAGGV